LGYKKIATFGFEDPYVQVTSYCADAVTRLCDGAVIRLSHP